ncbi:hypothetical protein [Moraxella sp. TY5]
MNYLAPRQGIFAIILLISFCLNIIMLVFSTEKQQYEYRTDKGEKIVEQLGKESMTAIANQDRISLSVLANRYQVDNDIAKLVISDQNKQTLVQIGQSQTETGQVIEDNIIQNNQLLGYASVTMKAVSKGEIISGQWLFLLGSAILHGFLWLIYGYLARPTRQQLEQLGEKVQQRLALARINNENMATTGVADPQPSSEEALSVEQDSRSITDFLYPNKNQTDSDSTLDDTQSFASELHTAENDAPNIYQTTAQPSVSPNVIVPAYNQYAQIQMQICFFDEFHLLDRVAPELANPYLRLCDQLFARTAESLFEHSHALINRYIKDVKLTQVSHFSTQGAVVHLSGKAEQLPLASVLLAKLVIMVNQVVYEKHRELSRFALPIHVGASLNQQYDAIHQLMANHGKEDGLLLLYPQPLLKTLDGQVQLKNIKHPTSVIEREALLYQGLSAILMKEMIEKRDTILTSSDTDNMDKSS